MYKSVEDEFDSYIKKIMLFGIDGHKELMEIYSDEICKTCRKNEVVYLNPQNPICEGVGCDTAYDYWLDSCDLAVALKKLKEWIKDN